MPELRFTYGYAHYGESQLPDLALKIWDITRDHARDQLAGTIIEGGTVFRLNPEYRWSLTDGPQGPELHVEHLDV